MTNLRPGLSERDRLVTRPRGDLPTAEDPKKPRGEPFDPKGKPPNGQAAAQKTEGLRYTA